MTADGTSEPTPNGTEPSTRPRAATHVLLGLAVLAIGAVVAWLTFSTTEGVGQREAPERSPRLVRVETAQPGRHQVTVTAWGETRPARTLTLRPRVAGRVSEVSPALEAGSVVTAGDTLLQLDRTDHRLALDRARTALTQAEADLELEKGQQAIARREYELLDQQVSDAERALILRKPQLATARADVEAAETDVTDARLALERTAVTGPFDALVRSDSVSVGAEVTTGTDLAELVGIDRWWVELAVPVNALEWLRFPGPDSEGSTVRLRHQGIWPQGVHREGRIVRLLGELEEEGRLARVLVAVDDPLARAQDSDQPRLLLGSFMQGAIEGRTLDAAVALDPDWLRSGSTVWLMGDDDRLVMRDVEVAYRDAERALVTDGLETGDRIVTTQLTTPAEGMPLRVEDEATGGDDTDGD